MDLAVTFLGTGGSVPSARRSTASVLVARGGERLLFDCGEGTQRQMQRSLGLVQADEIYLTHFHADHILGLPGLLKTYDLTDRQVPLKIYGPPGLTELFQVFSPLVGRLGYALDLVELGPGDAVEHDGYEVRPFEASHRNTRAYGYALVEAERPGRFDPAAAAAAGVPEGPAYAALQRGETVEGESGPVAPDSGDGPRAARAARSSSPATPHPARPPSPPRPTPTCSSTTLPSPRRRCSAPPKPATRPSARPPRVAAEAHVKMLALVHISSRYHVGKVIEEAKEVFEPTVAPKDFDVVELPFAERGEPQLIPNGARESRRDG